MDQDQQFLTSQTQNEEVPGPSGAKMIIVFSWIFSLVVVSYISFTVGKGTGSSQKSATAQAPIRQNVLGSTPSPTQAPVAPAASVDTTGICKKSGLSQKWEYLTPYTIKEGDSLGSIVEKQLGDASRLNEFTKLFENKNEIELVTSYDAKGKNPYPQRVTTNINLMRKINEAVVYITGETKKNAFKALKSDSGILAATPARILREMKGNVYVFTDIA